MTSPELKAGFCQDVVTLQNLGVRILVVHGGGPQINAMLEKVGVESRFEGGMRVSSEEVVDVAEMVLCGSVNKEISSTICSSGGRAIGLSGRDDSLLQCVKKINKDGYELGFVGEVESVNTKLLNDLLDMGICPVVSPIGTGIGEEKDIAYNVNADVAAGRIAGELRAARVLFLTDIAGVLDKEMKLLPSLSCDDVDALIEDETITAGMIPKVSVRVLRLVLVWFTIPNECSRTASSQSSSSSNIIICSLLFVFFFFFTVCHKRGQIRCRRCLYHRWKSSSCTTQRGLGGRCCWHWIWRRRYFCQPINNNLTIK